MTNPPEVMAFAKEYQTTVIELTQARSMCKVLQKKIDFNEISINALEGRQNNVVSYINKTIADLKQSKADNTAMIEILENIVYRATNNMTYEEIAELAVKDN